MTDGPRKKENVAIVLRFYEAFNARDTKTLLELLSKKHVDHTYFGRQAVTPEAIGRMLEGFWKAFPDWKETVDEIIDDGSGKVVVRATGRGTQTGMFMGRGATGKQIAAPLINTLRIADGKIVEYRSTFPWTVPHEEQINAGEDVQHMRAEQGGGLVASAPARAVLEDFESGAAKPVLLLPQAEREVEPSRCQALISETLRRCLNPAIPGTIYCDLHTDRGYGLTES